MAATGYTPISLYYSTTASAVPTAGNLANGELALNIADMKLYAKNSAGTVTLLASNASTTGVDSLSFGSTGLTPSTATTGAITVAGTLNVANGGTGKTSYTANGVLYASGTGTLANGSALTFDGTTLSLTTAGTNALTINTPDYGYFDLKNGTSTLRLQNNNSIPRVTTVGNYPLVFAINESEQVRLTSTGLLVGTTTNTYSAKLLVNGLSQATDGTTYQYMGYCTGGVAFSGTGTNHPYAIAINGSEKGRFDTSGNFIVGSASSTRVTIVGAGGTSAISETYATDAYSRWYIGRDAGNGGGSAIVFNNGGSAPTVGGVQMSNPSNNIIAWANGNGSTGWNERLRMTYNGGFSVGTTADPGAGAIYATGAITAYYSDERLKDVKGRITNALAKVRRLSGVYYTNNETAKSFGYTSDEIQVGVLANQMKGELPEIVKPAPFDLDENGNSKSGENYMTVQYDRGLPLLIEALKELADQFDDYVATH